MAEYQLRTKLPQAKRHVLQKGHLVRRGVKKPRNVSQAEAITIREGAN